MNRNTTAKHRPSVSDNENPNKEDEARQSKIIERYLKEEAVTWKRVQAEPKLLLLGTSDSGKSTLLKQLKIMHGGGFPAEEIENSKKSIRASLLTNCRVILVKSAASSGIPKFTDLAETVENDVTDFYELLPCMVALWADENMRKAFNELPQNSLPDTAPYFMSQIARIGSKDFIPSNEDVLKLRTVTQNISETIFSINQTNFHFFDVSGLKYHRKYWISYFSEVTSILFVVALSAYNQVMAEEDTTNRMTDAISLFKSIAGHELLKRPSIILFMNKKDLYDEKIKTSKITEFFPDFTGDSHSGIKYFEQKFMEVVEDKERYVISHATCATDTKAMAIIIGGIVAQIVSNLLSNSGLT